MRYIFCVTLLFGRDSLSLISRLQQNHNQKGKVEFHTRAHTFIDIYTYIHTEGEGLHIIITDEPRDPNFFV